MARFTTDFLTWLKGLFHTKTEVNTLLDKKINTVDVQGKITSFTNKDRINIERLINYMENGSGSNYYTLDLKGARGIININDEFESNPSPIFSDDKNRLATNNGRSPVTMFVLGGMIYKNGVAQTSDSTKITFKLIDGTVIGETGRKLNSNDINQGMKQYKVFKELWNSGVAWSPGIYYVYAEATINGSVIRSNILTVFVKDTNNLYDYARWSCGEYDNINIIANYGKAKITEQFSTIGEKSIALQQSNPANYGYFYVDSTNTLNSGENYTVSLDCYCPDANFTFTVRQDGELSRVTIPRNPSMQHISLSFTSNRSAYFRIQFFNDISDSRIFIDNLSCIKL